MVISRRMKLARHVAGVGKKRHAYTVLVGNPEGKNNLDDPAIDGRTILNWMLTKQFALM
jgi:hypothetical protein